MQGFPDWFLRRDPAEIKMAEALNPYSAGEQALGYIYQARFALLQLLQLPEGSSILIEKDDDVDILDQNGVKTLASLKHRAIGNRLSNLSTDFWKSVRIWLERYKRDGCSESNLRFFLFTTGTVSSGSFLQYFLFDGPRLSDSASLSSLTEKVLSHSTAELIIPIRDTLQLFKEAEKEDFLSRIVIFDNSPRIVDVPVLIQDRHMRSIRREFRKAIFERLEGWWNDTVINLLYGTRADEVYGHEISDKLYAFSEEYKLDNLPIQFRGVNPSKDIDTENDSRLFVMQLREIGISSGRIRSAILDYYRAFEQRSAWARENLLVARELEDYEDRIAEEWARYKDVIFENLDEQTAEAVLLEAGKSLYKWANLESVNSSSLRIRQRVTEPYVLRGGFHILANTRPLPRVYWHPQFLIRMGNLFGALE